ncbi:hypothetical protein C0Z22_13045 [Halobacteriovorax sp. DA5]|nr:hypothetical protein C0Z22_13045 [Halobacteriovorax sp. DA5]
MVTATTTGYGDITPLTSNVRNLVKYQILISIILMGLIVSAMSNLMGIIIRRSTRRK